MFTPSPPNTKLQPTLPQQRKSNKTVSFSFPRQSGQYDGNGQSTNNKTDTKTKHDIRSFLFSIYKFCDVPKRYTILITAQEHDFSKPCTPSNRLAVELKYFSVLIYIDYFGISLTQRFIGL
jgi:hypothetical protein